MGAKLGRKLIDLRKKNDLTQEEAVAKAERITMEGGHPYSSLISRSALANYEKGIRTPDNIKLRILADVYHEKYEELLSLAALDVAIEKGGEKTSQSPEQEEIYRHYIKTGFDKRQPDKSLFNESVPSAGNREQKTDPVSGSREMLNIPLAIPEDALVGGLRPSDLVITYSTRKEFVMLDQFRKLTPENRAKIEERIEMLLEFQKNTDKK